MDLRAELWSKAALRKVLAVMNEQEWQWASELQRQWGYWQDLDRTAGVMALRRYGWSYRKLGRLVGCSEWLIRYIEIVAQFSPQWKQWLREGRYSTRCLVDEWRRMRQAA